MKTAKIGAMFLISILALAGIGIGYAAWTDTITIDGTVNTGSVDIVVVDYSGLWVYKQLSTDLLIESPVIINDADHLYVAHSTAYDNGEDAVGFEFVNIFPCVWFKVDFVAHYIGTVPAKVNSVTYGFEAASNQYLLDNMDADVEAYLVADLSNGWVPVDEDGYEVTYENRIIVDVGYQLHNCDHVMVELWIHLPQDNDLMGLWAGGWADIELIQWNEYGLT